MAAITSRPAGWLAGWLAGWAELLAQVNSTGFPTPVSQRYTVVE